MESYKKAVILIGHGGLQGDIPSEIVEKFIRLHKSRMKTGGEATSQEIELDNTIRRWRRTPDTDFVLNGKKTISHTI